MVNFVTAVRQGKIHAEVYTHELYGYPAYFIGYTGDSKMAHWVAYVMRKAGVKGRLKKITPEEAAEYYAQPFSIFDLPLKRAVKVPDFNKESE